MVSKIRQHKPNIVVMASLVVVLIVGSPLTAAPGAATITLAEQTTVQGEEVRLGQLATFSGGDPETIAVLKAIRIGRAPLPGGSRVVSRDYILLRLRQAGVDTGTVVLEAPETITLLRRAVTISASDIEMLVREYVMAHPPVSGADLSITAVRVPGDVLLPTGNIQHTVEYLPQSGTSGTVPVNIFFTLDGTPVKRLLATVSILVMKDVPVTRRPIARYEMIQPEDLMMQTMDVSRLPADTVFAYEDIAGQRARRSIGPQRALRKDQFEFPPAVKRGDRVIIVAESSGLRITTIGEVQDTGRIGERVRVVNLDSNKTLYARVLDARTVRVQY
jgi:flagella basal body P-ring formation protein FlgA